MTIAIITLLGIVCGFAVKWIYRIWARKADPLEQHRKRYHEIDRQIISKASERISAGSSADLDELERLQKSKGGGAPGK